MSTHPPLALAAIPCGLAIRQRHAITGRQDHAGAQLLARCTVIGCMVFATPVFAQLSAPAIAASAPAKASPQELAEKHTTSVFRWIKIMADAPQRKTEAPKPQPKQEAVATTPRPPITKAPVATPEGTGSSEAHAVATVPRPASEPALAEPNEATPTTLVNPMPAATSRPAPTANATAATAAPAMESPAEVEPVLKLLSQAQPEVSDSLQEEVSGGKVVVEFTVQADGTVNQARAVSYTNRKLSKSAVEAVKKWVFEPLRAALTAQVEIEFKLQ